MIFTPWDANIGSVYTRTKSSARRKSRGGCATILWDCVSNEAREEHRTTRRPHQPQTDPRHSSSMGHPPPASTLLLSAATKCHRIYIYTVCIKPITCIICLHTKLVFSSLLCLCVCVALCHKIPFVRNSTIPLLRRGGLSTPVKISLLLSGYPVLSVIRVNTLWWWILGSKIKLYIILNKHLHVCFE